MQTAGTDVRDTPARAKPPENGGGEEEDDDNFQYGELLGQFPVLLLPRTNRVRLAPACDTSYRSP